MSFSQSDQILDSIEILLNKAMKDAGNVVLAEGHVSGVHIRNRYSVIVNGVEHTVKAPQGLIFAVGDYVQVILPGHDWTKALILG